MSQQIIYSGRPLRGFTLIELMITVTILAIIVGVAVPAYTSQIHKSRRTDARNAILDLAGREERWLSVNNSYSGVAANMGYGAFPVVLTNGFYNLTVAVPDPAAVVTTQSFIVTATAIGVQATDTACASFTVNQTGLQKAYTSANVDNTTTCWGL